MPDRDANSHDAKKRTWVAEVELTVQFYDLDPMEVVWHGNYAKYFERARCALLDDIQYNYAEMKASGFAWPVIDMTVKYLQPLVFGQTVVVRAELVEYEHWMRIDYVITDKASGQRLTKGSTRQVAVDMSTKLMNLQSPQIFLERLGVVTA
ncbi:MAG: acyl-CoA thioesterase [Gemmatimonas sp.]